MTHHLIVSTSRSVKLTGPGTLLLTGTYFSALVGIK